MTELPNLQLLRWRVEPAVNEASNAYWRTLVKALSDGTDATKPSAILEDSTERMKWQRATRTAVNNWLALGVGAAESEAPHVPVYGDSDNLDVPPTAAIGRLTPGRVREITRDADMAFWQTIEARFPEISGIDLGHRAESQWRRDADSVAETWIRDNYPDLFEDLPPIEAKGGWTKLEPGELASVRMMGQPPSADMSLLN